MEIQYVGKCCFSVLEREKKTIDSYDFAVGIFARIGFCLSLETGDKWILSLEMTSVMLWFFDQSEAEKIEKNNNVN